MTEASIRDTLTPDDVIAAIEQMEPAQAEKITRRLLYLQASRRIAKISDRETELLRQIFREKRADFQNRFDQLSSKRNSFTLTPDEHQELLSLVDESEAFTVGRMQALGELAQLRHITLPDLMVQLGLKAPPVA